MLILKLDVAEADPFLSMHELKASLFCLVK